MTDSVSEFRELTESAVQLLFAAEAGLAIAAAASGYAAAGQAAGAGRNALTGSSALDDVYSGARGYWDDLFGAGCRMGNSFVPGTGVLMADGTTKPIEDVNVGDYVWATDPQSGEAGPRRVTKRLSATA